VEVVGLMHVVAPKTPKPPTADRDQGVLLLAFLRAYRAVPRKRGQEAGLPK
jgi:hypothetical protein